MEEREAMNSFPKEALLELDGEDQNPLETKDGRPDDEMSGSSGTLAFSDEDYEGMNKAKSSYYHIPYGFQSIGCYKHASKNCEIGGGKYEFILDE